jgi:hypothetical protein
MKFALLGGALIMWRPGEVGDADLAGHLSESVARVTEIKRNKKMVCLALPSRPFEY